MAHDPETGQLPEDGLSWQLDLHHDQHTHPGLGPVSGQSSGYYVVPKVGETSDNVWLRIYLTARDQAGLTSTVFQDVFPKKTVLRVESTPPGLQVRIDGKTRTTPADVWSVEGLFHQVEPPAFLFLQDSMRVFHRWRNGSTRSDTTVYADAEVTTLHALYEDIALRGKGVYGIYYLLNADTTFGTEMFTRIDTIIRFSWGNASPDPKLPADFFAVRWLGAIEPHFTETVYFHIESDDGFRFWVGDQLVAESWITKNPTEVTGSVFLEKGNVYPIRLDYFEYEGGASAKLSWSSASIPKQVIPKTLLYPRLPENPGFVNEKFDLHLYPNPASNLLAIQIDAEFQESFHLRLIDALGRVVREWRNQRVEEPGHRLLWPVADLQAGMYWVEVEREGLPVIRRTLYKN